MKRSTKHFRMMILCMAAAVLGAAYALAQETNPIYSMNTYGFKRVNILSNSYHLVSVPFNTRPSDVNGAIGPQLTGSDDPGAADKIITWDSGSQSYRTMYLLNDVDGTNYDYKWIDTSQDPPGVATTALASGQGFWIRSQQNANQTIVLVGEVVTTPSYTNTIVPGLQMLAYPFSTTIELNKTTLSHGATSGSGLEDADSIMMYDPATRQFSYFYLLGNVGDTNYNYKWIDMSLDPDDVATSLLQPSQAFWYRHRGTNVFEWIEPIPY
ncbi:MAG: hypothetical protein V2A34_00495 [Lentisphaerota bacterium]